MFNFLPFASRNGVLYDILVAGGGASGGSGSDIDGGGGSGGYLVIAEQVPLRDFGTSFAVVVGAATGAANLDGNPSSFGDIIRCNGGKAGAISVLSSPNITGNPGSPLVADNSFYGSGAAGGNGSSKAAGGIGFRFGGPGGKYSNSAYPLVSSAGGGGGGAGAGGNGGPGGDYSGASNSPGTGGPGVVSAISGSSVTYCAGGAGGWHDSSGKAGTNGAANTGSGGSGGGLGGLAGFGAAGVVVVRAPVGATAATGGAITTDATYRYHRFTSNGTFALP